jgi:hypothetical protein
MSLVRVRCTSNLATLGRIISGRGFVAIPSDRAVSGGPPLAPVATTTAQVKDQGEDLGPKLGIPDINSTDIGAVPDPHTHDPKKWQKFAWKYLGALVTFGVAYKVLHWYVAKVEKEGKQRREDMEVNKTAKHETAADRAARREQDAASAAALLANVQNPMGLPEAASSIAHPQGTGSESVLNGVPKDFHDMSFQVFKPVQEDEKFVSQEDSLKLLEVELEAKLKMLRSQNKRSRETDAEKKKIEDELRDLRMELVMFAADKVPASVNVEGGKSPSSGTAAVDNIEGDTD